MLVGVNATLSSVLCLTGLLVGARTQSPERPDEARTTPAVAPRGVAPARDGVTLVQIDGPLDVGTLSLVKRAREGAASRGDRLVVEMNTPGGEIQLMWNLAKALSAASEDDGLLTVTWVNDQALSAGALVAMACDRLYMRSRATIGSATAITLGTGGPQPISEDAAVAEKFNSSFRSGFRGWAEDHGRSGAVAEAMVDADVEVRQVRVDGELRVVTGKEENDLISQGKKVQLVKTIVQRGELLNLTGREAMDLEFIDGIAETLEEVLERIGAAGVAPTIVVRQRSEDLASWLDMLAPLLFIGGLVLAFIELKAPGFGVAGIGSLACFGLLFFGRYLTGLADVPHIVLFALGVMLIAAEVFLVPGTLWLGVLGGLCVLVGLIWSNLGPGLGLEYALDRDIAISAGATTVLWMGLAMVVMYVVGRFLPDIPILNRLALETRDGTVASAMPMRQDARFGAAQVGAAGRALTTLRPVGKVVLDAAPDLEFEARSPGGVVEAGSAVRVVEVRASGRLLVEASGDGA
jgi:membrane-bound serine protease (ClpP class)